MYRKNHNPVILHLDLTVHGSRISHLIVHTIETFAL